MHMPSLNLTLKFSFEPWFRVFIINGMDRKIKRLQSVDFLFTLSLFFPPLRRNLDMLWSHGFLLFWCFWKMKKNIACFNLSLVIQFSLRGFAVSAVSFFRSFLPFVSKLIKTDSPELNRNVSSMPLLLFS